MSCVCLCNVQTALEQPDSHRTVFMSFKTHAGCGFYKHFVVRFMSCSLHTVYVSQYQILHNTYLIHLSEDIGQEVNIKCNKRANMGSFLSVKSYEIYQT